MAAQGSAVRKWARARAPASPIRFEAALGAGGTVFFRDVGIRYVAFCPRTRILACNGEWPAIQGSRLFESLNTTQREFNSIKYEFDEYDGWKLGADAGAGSR